MSGLRAAACAACLFAGLAARAPAAGASSDHSEAAARLDAMDIMYSSKGEGLVRACLEPGEFEGKLTLILSVGPDGRILWADCTESVTTSEKACIEAALSAVPFMETDAGFTVELHYTFRIEKTGKKPSTKPGGDPAAWRLVYTQTAFSIGKGELGFTDVDGVDLIFSYGVTDSLSVTVNATLPTVFWGLVAGVKYTFEVTPWLRAGFAVHGGVVWPFFWDDFSESDDEHYLGIMAGGAPLLLTFGSPDLSLTLSLHVEMISSLHWWLERGRYEYFDDDTQLVFLADVGGGIKVARNTKIIAEVWTLLSPTPGLSFLNGFIWGIMPGVRYFRETFHLDVCAAVVVLPDLDKGTGRITAYGGPLISFGFR
jgi:hypothetical protein